MKITPLITVASALALITAGCNKQQQNQQAFCVDRSGNPVNPRYCDDDYRSHGGGAFMFMPYSTYKSRYPTRYATAVKSYSRSGYSSHSSAVSRSISGSSARGFSSGYSGSSAS